MNREEAQRELDEVMRFLESEGYVKTLARLRASVAVLQSHTESGERELLPCPFCGEGALTERKQFADAVRHVALEEAAKVAEGFAPSERGRTKGMAIAANIRSLLPTPPSESREDDGAALVAAERHRQIVKEGWSAEHDDTHNHGDLAVSAAILAVADTDASVHDPLDRDGWGLAAKHRHDPIRRMVIAGALICAEIDRMLRRQALKEKSK